MVEEDLVDYEEDPMPEQEVWAHQRNPAMDPWGKSPISSTAATHLTPHPPRTGKKQHPAVNIEDFPVLECSPLSPATLHLVGSCMQSSPSFDSPLPNPSQHPPTPPSRVTQPYLTSSISLASEGPSNIQHPSQYFIQPTSCSLNPHSPIRSGCFNSPLLSTRPTRSAQHITSNPCRNLLKEIPTGRLSDKQKKSRCLRDIDSDINLTFGEDVQMADALDTTRKVLVERVRGRTYSVEIL